ncbi:HAD-IA family hydrolase [Limibaculum sp. FT325]|uniref:HAD-IA family hydrolase n=1 Tax=Thermohalobaculum sediminis TaxID=2939436 RepID=UPI0020BF06E4|nr:HAD-IA family hydrolase [Limibaculum sediminis]MCL5777264.1 HAD-IA family hydrolase [Limibaculum sediminis]
MPADAPLKLVIFDVDGTLIDSQNFIVAAMDRAFAITGLPAPAREATLGIVGLSLPQAMMALVPGATATVVDGLVHHYKESFVELRRQTGGEAGAPFYPGARDAIERLDRAGWLLSIATGKARRGLDHMLDSHGLRRFFVGTQTADDAPSKPHPGMVLNCLAATGVEARRAVMVGDTEFDIAMARAAGARAVGVAWGYHARERLAAAGAEVIVDDFAALDAALEAVTAA